MDIIRSIRELRERLEPERRQERRVGFVPTMGYLHEGHMSLVRAARADCDIVVLSIFVNPAQFGPGEDLERYPRDTQRDMVMAREGGVDVVFMPSAEEMYPEGYSTYVGVEGHITECMCGASRPGHFRGVTTVVSKLFNIVLPDAAYFGQKDAQQAAVIKRMVKDLDIPVEIKVMPIVREDDGLAMSSRNVYLSSDERDQALLIIQALSSAGDSVRAGERSPEKVRETVREILARGGGMDVDYISVVDAEELREVSVIKGDVLVAVAVRLGNTRLIDNVVIQGQEEG